MQSHVKTQWSPEVWLNVKTLEMEMAGESPGNCGQLYLQNLTGRGVCGHGVPTVLWVLTYKDGSFIYTTASERKRRAWGKFWGWERCSLTGLWWGRHRCRHMSKLIRLHVGNTCSRFYIDHASKNNARSQMTASDYGWTPAIHKQRDPCCGQERSTPPMWSAQLGERRDRPRRHANPLPFFRVTPFLLSPFHFTDLFPTSPQEKLVVSKLVDAGKLDNQAWPTLWYMSHRLWANAKN